MSEAGLNAYLGLRDLALSTEAEAAGIRPTDAHPLVWGVVMEIGLPGATVTIVVLADGTTSMYTSAGGGIIGGGEQADIAAASRAFVSVAAKCVDALAPAIVFRRPAAGAIAFHVLTFRGNRTAEVAEQTLEGGSHLLSPLFTAAHDVISRLREFDEARRRR